MQCTNNNPIDRVGRNIGVPRREEEADDAFAARLHDTIDRWLWSLQETHEIACGRRAPSTLIVPGH